MQAVWDEKFKEADFIYGEAPNAFVQENFDRLENAQNILCLGEGEGRNALFLAEQGIAHVEALDASFVALSKLRRYAKERYLRITVHHTLLNQWDAPTNLYDAIVCTYLHLPNDEQPLLFEKSLQALKEKGLFIAEFFSKSQLQFKSGGPRDEKILYDLHELSQILKKLPCHVHKLSQEIVILNEGEKHKGRGSVIRMILEKTA
ncbi:SAM-dependent methyltransferase [Sulfurospirillum barnesii]|uniref:Tellurite resistance protein TehB n=1 Tax=Sulfurospirillum barnesii (strain ATCC 700032 / DSM 10660 / SES-3) TaxID=760154 RepID=I3Y0P8_SULBS|nr:class I SAM-dependent methyltransferase [Sulfurospirillum barnesii]AFL69772.1 Tellurite resistance protein TehB [Sulfurospirillum barnesii SES-3]